MTKITVNCTRVCSFNYPTPFSGFALAIREFAKDGELERCK